jgi:hypothetical protein
MTVLGLLLAAASTYTSNYLQLRNSDSTSTSESTRSAGEAWKLSASVRVKELPLRCPLYRWDYSLSLLQANSSCCRPSADGLGVARGTHLQSAFKS